MTASGDTTIGEADAALRSESALLDERLPVRWDGEIIHWTDRWTDIGDMLFLCGNNRLRTLRHAPAQTVDVNGTSTGPTYGSHGASQAARPEAGYA